MRVVRIIFLALVTCAVFHSCSVYKRHYRPGYYFADLHRSKKEKEGVDWQKKEAELRTSSNYNMLVADAGRHLRDLDFQRNLSASPDSCDHIRLHAGDEIKGRVMEVGTDLIRYKRCDMPDGPMYSVRKSDVAKITYTNGTFDTFSGTPAVISSPAPSPPPRAEPEKKRKGFNVRAFMSFLIPFAIFFTFVAPDGIFAAFAILLVASIVLGVIGIHESKTGGGFGTKFFAVSGIILSLLLGLSLLLVAAAM